MRSLGCREEGRRETESSSSPGRFPDLGLRLQTWLEGSEYGREKLLLVEVGLAIAPNHRVAASISVR